MVVMTLMYVVEESFGCVLRNYNIGNWLFSYLHSIVIFLFFGTAKENMMERKETGMLLNSNSISGFTTILGAE